MIKLTNTNTLKLNQRQAEGRESHFEEKPEDGFKLTGDFNELKASMERIYDQPVYLEVSTPEGQYEFQLPDDFNTAKKHLALQYGIQIHKSLLKEVFFTKEHEIKY